MASRKEILTIIIMLIATAVGMVGQTIVSTSLNAIMLDFNVSATTAQWIMTIYILILGVMIPPTAYLTHRFKTKTLITAALSVFTVGSVIGFVAPNITVLITGRILQAAGSGILLPILQIAIFKILPEDRWNVTMSLVGLTIAIAPSIAPTLGGSIVDSMGWRAIFEILTIIGIAILVLTVIFTKNLSETEDYPLDVISLILSIAMCLCPILGLSNITAYGIGNLEYVWIPIIVGLIALYLFVNRQRKIKDPLLNLKVIRNKYFCAGTFILAFMQFTTIGITIILPIYVQSTCGLSSTTAGLILLPGTAFMAVTNFIGPNLADKIGAKKVLIISSVIMTIGLVWMGLFNTNTSVMEMIISQIVRCGGIGLGLVTSATWALSVATYDIEDASAINNTFRQIIGASGSAILTAIMVGLAGGAMAANEISIQAFDITCLLTALLGIACLIISIIYVKDKDIVRKELGMEG